MGRPRQFDEDAVLDAASEIFWARGYEATSTRELTACTGLTPSSIYAAFGDKRGLFRRALDHYLARLRGKMARLDEAGSPGRAIAGFFQDTIDQSLADPAQRGCMLVNSALEATPQEPELREAVAGELRLIEAFFRDRVAAAQRVGEISAACSADDAARQLLALLLGLRVLARVRPEPPLLTGAANQALAALGLPPLQTSGVPQ